MNLNNLEPVLQSLNILISLVIDNPNFTYGFILGCIHIASMNYYRPFSLYPKTN
jgi:hypothetical protein